MMVVSYILMLFTVLIWRRNDSKSKNTEETKTAYSYDGGEHFEARLVHLVGGGPNTGTVQ